MDSFKLQKIREYMAEKGIDGILVDSWQNVFYLSGFTGYGDATLLIAGKNQYIFTDSRYTVQVKQQCDEFTFIETYKHDAKAIAEKIKSENIKKLGFEENVASYKEYQELYLKIGAEALAPISEIFFNLRQIKTKEELESIEKACEIGSLALVETFNYIKPGVKETEIAARLEYEMRMRGAEKPSFDTVVASGIRGSMPHGTATEKLIESGEAVTIDFGVFYHGMCSDCTRTVFVGEPKDSKMVEIYNIVYEAQTTALNGYVDGMKACELDKIARDIIEGKGYGKEFGHATGHGVGIDIHEGVTISKRSEQLLGDGLVFSVEPGIYVEGLGGVRIEDLVTPENGRLKVLTKAPKKEIIIL